MANISKLPQSISSVLSFDGLNNYVEIPFTTVLSFDGLGDHIEIPYAPVLNSQQFTITCWVNVRDGQGLWRSVIASRDLSPERGYALYADNYNRWHFALGSSKGWISLRGGDVLSDTWTFLGATYDGTTINFYANGKLMAARESDYVVNTARPLRIGSGGTEGNPHGFFPGEIAEVRVWNYACNQAEIQDQMNSRSVGSELGLTGYWPLNESSGIVVRDQTANGNHGTMFSYVEIPYAAALHPQEFTICCWVNVQGWQGSWRSVISSGDISPQQGYTIYAGDDNKWQLWFSTGEAVWSGITGSEVQLNTRTFLAATYSENKMTLYINGELIGEKEAAYIPNSTRPLRIGAGLPEGPPDSFFPGEITEVQIWNRACTQTEITNVMNGQTTDNDPGLVGYWPLSSRLDSIVRDQTSLGNHGIVKRASWQLSKKLLFASQSLPVYSQNSTPDDTVISI